MPRYQITDSQTGRTLVVEGDTPPTEQDASQLFDSRAGQAAIAVFKAQQQRDISNIKLDPYQQIQMQGQQGAMEEGNSDFLTAIGRNPVGFVKSLPADAAQMVEGAAAGIGNLPVRAYRALAGTPQIAVIQKDANGKDVLMQEPKPLPFQPNQPVVQFPRTVMQPEGNDLERMVEGLLTPGNIAAFPFAATKPVQAYFLAQTAPGAIDAAGRLFSPGMSGDERKAAATDLLLNGLMSYGLAKGMMHQAGQVAPETVPADYAIPPEPPAPAAPEPAQAPAEVQPPEASPAVPVESPAPAVNPGPVVAPPVEPTVVPASEVANQTPNDAVAQDRRLLAAWEGMGRILDAFNAGKVDEKFVRDSLDKYQSITGQPYKLPLPGDWTENLDEYLKAKQPAATESAPTDSPGPAVTPATPPESSLPAEATAPAQPEASAEPTPPAPTNIPNVGEQPAVGPAKPAIIPNPLTEEDVAQNAVVQGKPLDARFVSDNGFEGQLTEHGYVRQGDQWVPAASKPLEPLNQWGVPESQWREMAKFTTGEQLRRWGTTRARIMEQKMVQPVLSYPAIHDYLQQYVYGKAKGVHVPDVKFEVGRWSEPVLKDLQRFIPDVKDAQVTISGRALKHADEGHHDDLMGMQHELPNAIATAGEFLHNDKRPNSAYLVHRVAGKDFLIVTELARTGSGTEIVNLFHRKAADLERLRKKSNQWLEGAKSSSSNRASDRPGLLSGAQPQAKPNADTGKVNLHPYKVGDEVLYQGKRQKVTRAVPGGNFIAVGKRAVHFKDVQPVESKLPAGKPSISDLDLARQVLQKEGKLGISLLQRRAKLPYERARKAVSDLEKLKEIVPVETGGYMPVRMEGRSNTETRPQPESIAEKAAKVTNRNRPGAAGSVPLLGDGGELGETKPPGTTPPADDRSFSAFNAMPMGMPEAVRVAKALTGVYPKIRERLGRFAGVFRYRQGEGARGHIEILASQFRVISDERMKQLRQQAADYAKVAAEEGDNPADIARERYDYLLQQEVIKQPVAALKTMWHEIGHVVDWLPDHIIRGRGNILGRIASLRDFTKHVLPFDPTRPAGQKITPADKARLMKAAQESLRQEMGPILETVRKIIVEEPEWRIVGITPEDIKNILRESAGKETPELTRWFSEQSDKTKADILRKAMRGMVDERLSALGKKEQVGTRRTERIVREKVGREPTPEEIKARFAELLAKEIKARNLADLATIKNELSELIAWWRGTATIPDYFKTAAEMYADAFSVWANNPAAVVKRAPMYSELMWNYLDRKPEVKALYNEIQQQIKSGQIMGHRVSDLLAMWDGDDARSLELSRESRQTSRRDFYDNVVYHFDRRFGPIYRAAKGYVGKGRVKEAVAQFLYRATEHERFLGELNRVVGQRLVKAGLDWSHDLGEYLFHQRVTHERFNLANPGGWTPKDSADRLAEMQQQLGPERWRELESAAKEWHGLYQTHVVGPVVASGMFTPELADVLTSRAHYATFAAVKGIADDGLQRIIDQRFGKTNGPQIYRQIGNLGEIKNPATATVLKGLSLISAVYRNDMKRQVVEMLRVQDPENIVPARTRWNGKFNEPVMIQNHDKVGTVAFMQNGRLHAFYVRKVVADAVNGASPTENKIFNAFVKVNGWSKALFTQLNYAFWPVNFVRDTAGFMYQMPGFPALAYAKNLPKALAAARQSVLHTKPNPVADEALRRKLVISKADPRGVYAQADNEFELKVASHGMEPAAWEKEHGKVAAIVKAWNWYRELGETIERVNKISGMLYLDEKFPNLPEWQKREIIRERSGSPNFLERGASNPAVDMLFLFYNPWKEGVRSVVKAVRDNPYSFAGKAVATIAMPTILQAAAVNGWLGPNRKKEYASIPDYDLTNYLCVPLGWADESQRKIIYLRLPLWEPARIAHGSLFQTLTDRGAGILNNAGGQLPGINPVWQVGLAWSEYALGKNPIDLDRAANVMPDTTFQAGGLPALEQMGQYTWNTMGGSILTRFKNLNLEAPPETVGEKFLALPVVNNALGRWVKVSNSGLRDQDRATIAETEKQRAQIRLAAQQIADKILTQQALSPSERMMLREPYAQQYLTRILPEMAKSRASVQYKRLSSAPDLESRAAIARQMQKGN